ncbi:MAG: FAD-dependent oxidoreductase [Pseudonocardiales bacterium]|nr:FAD-dependent oxidoreductase [Hyphomicrobiales bacterium]MBV8825528.1 FAD-dependent oxidoreductase [Hyphomicrobiales bacterium]MBV9429454.1 FAD-dependent oxidoreductase [Bradyrhizobiaceae bacterium]MBV9728122.1 FAD-dependent oxidoreductase [Pseudonocardiales bacterium]
MEIAELRGPQPMRGEFADAVRAGNVIAAVRPITQRRRVRSERAPHVIIVGAGLAGLCAAYELQGHGCTYTILEAETQHVGGRVRTARFSDGSYGELGAMRIPEQHALARKYVKDEFNLPTRAFVTSSEAAFYLGRGRRVRIGRVKRQVAAGQPDSLRQAYRLNACEAQRSPAELWDRAVLSHIRALAADERCELRDSNVFKTRRLIELDRFSLRRLIELSGLSNEAIEYLLAISGLRTLQHSAVTELLREELCGIWSNPGFYEIVGGMELLPKAFLHRLRSKPRMGCEVIDFQQDQHPNRVAAIYRHRTRPHKHEREEADFLICTIPLPVLARLEAHRRFSPEKQVAMRDLRYESATKLLIPTTTRFWEKNEGIFGGASYTDLMPGSVYYPSDNVGRDEARMAGPGILAVSDCWGQEARWLGHMRAAERGALMIETLGKTLHAELLQPGTVRHDEVRSWYWDGHPWASGAFAFYMPGQFATLHHHVTAPEGRIYLAGEHCSRMHSWMEGALASAHDAVASILAQAKAAGAVNRSRAFLDA